MEHVDEDGVCTPLPIKPKRVLQGAEAISARVKAAGRARTSLRRAVQTMVADSLLTLTFRRNLTDIQEAWPVAIRFLRLMREAHPKGFSYVIVAERQKRGAWHFHLALRGWQDLALIRASWKRAGGCGNIDVQPFVGPNHKLASYVSKYISKSFTDDELDRRSHHRYRRSQDLTPEQFTQVVTVDPAEARQAIRRLFAEAGLVGFAHFVAADASRFDYFVWGCTWLDEPPDPI